MKFEIHNPNFQYADRDIILLTLESGKKQLFYRSTGRNSNTPGVWYPFNGVRPGVSQFIWFDKGEFCNKNPELHRYGTSEYKEISKTLKEMNIPASTKIVFPWDINELIGDPSLVEASKRYRQVLQF